MKGAIFMLMVNNAYLNFNMDSVQNMPSWVREEKYYNCENFFNMIALPRRIKKIKKTK